VKIGWAWIDSASFSLYVYSMSVVLQALTVISMGGIADHPPHRKRLLLFFAFLGASAAALFLVLPSSSPVWFLAAVLAMLANVGFGASVVAMNAYLPTLAKESPEVVRIFHELQQAQVSNLGLVDGTHHDLDGSLPDNVQESLLPRLETNETTLLKTKYASELSTATSRISSLGIALGYVAGILLLLVALIPVTKLHGSTFSLRLAIGLSGIWWAVFSIPAALWLPDPETVSDIDETAGWSDNSRVDIKWNLRREIVGAWQRLGAMLRWREMKRLKHTFRYLAAWFLLSDGFTTITSTAILFGKTTLNMQPSALILVGALTTTAGICGSLLWPFIQRRCRWTNHKILIMLVVLCSMVPAYGCLGFLAVLRRAKFGGLTTQGEMFGLAVYFGSVYGAFQSYARACYAELLPPGEEARWYGLYSITDKSSSFIGPLVVGLIADATGNIRYAFFFMLFMIWLAVPVLMSVDVERGRSDAGEYRYSSTGVD